MASGKKEYNKRNKTLIINKIKTKKSLPDDMPDGYQMDFHLASNWHGHSQATTYQAAHSYQLPTDQ